jgi:stage IV sporulation protein B
MKKNKFKCICWILAPIIFLTMLTINKVHNIPSTLFIREGHKIQDNYLLKLTEKQGVQPASVSKIYDRKINVSLLGLLPVKSVSIKTVPSEIMLYPGGQPIGVKLNTKGVLVVALSDVETKNGKVSSPAATTGIQIGDSILKIGNTIINSSENLVKEINLLQGEEILVTVDRKGEEFTKKIMPIKNAADNSYKIGLWVRDSTAGVGTLTFYDESSGKFAALGHPITDVDTGTILSINSGEIVSSSIVSIRRGARGNPGELKGIFVNEESNTGNIFKNTECGIFGKANCSLINNSYNKPLKIALRAEIKEGPAKILTTIDGNEPKLYSIQIQKLLSQDVPGPKSMIIKITDPILLEKTGGIVQGMSGSPIIQDNKIVGAVTHVLINKPEQGYGIYIEWMLKDADILSK